MPNKTSAIPAGKIPERSDGRQSVKRATLIFFLIFFWCGFFSLFGVDFHHDGVVLIPAMRIAAGEALFRDAFCQYGWLLPLIQGGALAVFGGELLVLKWLSALFYALAAVECDRIWKRFLSPRTDWIAVLLFALLLPDTMVTAHPWSSVPALWTLLATLHHLLCYWEERKNSSLLYAGIFAGVTFLFRHPCGIAVLAAGTFLLLLELLLTAAGERKKAFCRIGPFWFGGFLLALLPALTVITLTGAWHDFFRQCCSFVYVFVRHRGAEGSWEYFSSCLFPILTPDFWYCNSIFALLPLTALLILAQRCFALLRCGRGRRKEALRKDLPLLSLIIFSLASWHQYYPVPCVRHLFWGGIPMVGFMPLFWKKMRAREFRFRMAAAVWSGILLLSCLISLAPRVIGGWLRVSTFSAWYVSDIPGISGMRLSAGEIRCIREFRRHADALPPEFAAQGIFNDTQDSLWSVLLPECRFRHPQFYRIVNSPYPDYDEKSKAFAETVHTAVLTEDPFRFPAWRIFFRAGYLGKEYFLMLPPDADGPGKNFPK